MSKPPEWLNKANQNKTGNTVGVPAEVNQLRAKPGPKKSLVPRKTVGLKFSAKCNADIDTLEQQLKLSGFDITRGRSEAVEVAVGVLLHLFSQNNNLGIDDFIRNFVGNEEGKVNN